MMASDTYIPLVLTETSSGKEMARFNHDGTWTISDWEAIRQKAAQKIGFDNGTTVGIARLLMAARGNFYEISMSKAKKIAEDAGEEYIKFQHDSALIDEFFGGEI